MTAGRRLLHWTTLVACAGVSPIAVAAEADQAEIFEFGVGLLGNLGLASLGEPTETRLSAGTTYPSFAGLALSGGLMLEARFFRYVGLEVGAAYGRDSLNGDVTQGTSTTNITIDHPVLRFPMLVKGILPLGDWAPFVVAGPEVTVFRLSSTQSDPQGGVQAVASAASSLWWTVGAGVEWRTPLEAIDLRIPVSVRLNLNPNVEDDLANRATLLPSGALVLDDSAPRLRASMQLGAALYF